MFLGLPQLTFPPALQYVKWAGAKGPDAFFTDKKARKLFKDHIDVIVNRRNSINGKLYKEVMPFLQSAIWPIQATPVCEESTKLCRGLTGGSVLLHVLSAISSLSGSDRSSCVLIRCCLVVYAW